MERSLHNAQYSESNLEYYDGFLRSMKRKYSAEQLSAAKERPTYDTAYKLTHEEEYFELLMEYE